MIRKTLKTALIVFLTLFSFTVFAFAGTIQLPKTGQTKCYDTNK